MAFARLPLNKLKLKHCDVKIRPSGIVHCSSFIGNPIQSVLTISDWVTVTMVTKINPKLYDYLSSMIGVDHIFGDKTLQMDHIVNYTNSLAFN